MGLSLIDNKMTVFLPKWDRLRCYAPLDEPLERAGFYAFGWVFNFSGDIPLSRV
jgi:hypothetical protein